MTSGFFLNGNRSVRTQKKNIDSENSEGNNISDENFNQRGSKYIRSEKKKRSSAPRNKKRKMSNFKRYETYAAKVKKSGFIDDVKELDRSKDSYLYEDENISDCDHDNPAGILIELYK